MKSRSPSLIDRFLVVFHSPTGMAETGLPTRRSEKMKVVGAWVSSAGYSLQSGLREKQRIWRAFREDFNQLGMGRAAKIPTQAKTGLEWGTRQSL